MGGLCSNDNTDFDPGQLGIEDVTNIIDSFDENVMSAVGSRDHSGDLGILVTLSDDDVDTFELCFENVIVTTAFNDTRGDLDSASGFVNYSTSGGENIICDSEGLPCLNFFFGCDEDLIGPEVSQDVVVISSAR